MSYVIHSYRHALNNLPGGKWGLYLHRGGVSRTEFNKSNVTKVALEFNNLTIKVYRWASMYDTLGGRVV